MGSRELPNGADPVVEMEDLPLVEDPALELRPGHFGVRISEDGLRVPLALDRVLRQLGVLTAQQFVSYLTSFGEVVGELLRWKSREIDRAQNSPIRCAVWSLPNCSAHRVGRIPRPAQTPAGERRRTTRRPGTTDRCGATPIASKVWAAPSREAPSNPPWRRMSDPAEHFEVEAGTARDSNPANRSTATNPRMCTARGARGDDGITRPPRASPAPSAGAPVPSSIPGYGHGMKLRPTSNPDPLLEPAP